MESSKNKNEMLKKKILKAMKSYLLAYNREIRKDVNHEKSKLVKAPSKMTEKELKSYFKKNVTTKKNSSSYVHIREYKHKTNGFEKEYTFKKSKDKIKKSNEKRKQKKEAKKNKPSKGPMTKKWKSKDE